MHRIKVGDDVWNGSGDILEAVGLDCKGAVQCVNHHLGHGFQELLKTLFELLLPTTIESGKKT